KCIAYLCDLALEVFTDVVFPKYADERHSFTVGAQARSDPRIYASGHVAVHGTRSVGVSRKAVGLRGWVHARIGHQVGVLGMQECPLALAEIAETKFIDCTGIQSPGMAEVDRLDALLGGSSEPRDMGATGLELGEGVERSVVSEVAIGAELLRRLYPAVKTNGEVLGTIAADGNPGEGTVRKIAMRHEAQQIHGYRVHTFVGDDVVDKYVRIVGTHEDRAWGYSRRTPRTLIKNGGSSVRIDGPRKLRLS